VTDSQRTAVSWLAAGFLIGAVVMVGVCWTLDKDFVSRAVRREEHQKAIAAGAGRYVVDDAGKVEFRYGREP
jgi:hypothetical protein